MSMRVDILIRDRKIHALYRRGIPRKQISAHIRWVPIMSYEAIKKVIQKYEGPERRGTVRF